MLKSCSSVTLPSCNLLGARRRRLRYWRSRVGVVLAAPSCRGDVDLSRKVAFELHCRPARRSHRSRFEFARFAAAFVLALAREGKRLRRLLKRPMRGRSWPQECRLGGQSSEALYGRFSGIRRTRSGLESSRVASRVSCGQGAAELHQSCFQRDAGGGRPCACLLCGFVARVAAGFVGH